MGRASLLKSTHAGADSSRMPANRGTPRPRLAANQAVLMTRQTLVPAIAAFVLSCAAPALAADEVHWTLTGPSSVTFDWRGPETTLAFGPTPSYGAVAAARTPNP